MSEKPGVSTKLPCALENLTAFELAVAHITMSLMLQVTAFLRSTTQDPLTHRRLAFT